MLVIDKAKTLPDRGAKGAVERDGPKWAKNSDAHIEEIFFIIIMASRN